MQIAEIILLPYTRPRAREIPRIRPTIREINVRIRVMYNPSKRLGSDSIRKLKNSAVFLPP
jgi:hypothetical protein